MQMDRQTFGEGDSYVIDSILPPDLAKRAFTEILANTQWHDMHHKGGPVPRLISAQGRLGHGSLTTRTGSSTTTKDVEYLPLYRHPADTQIPCQQFQPVVAEIAAHVSQVLGQDLNHALVQYYRTGNDLITEHADKTLDLNEGSVIVNVSLGYARAMTLRTKTKSSDTSSKDSQETPKRESQRVLLRDNSLFVLGPQTNQKWLHGIRPDKTAGGLADDGSSGRISLTFRSIGTFVTTDPADSGAKLLFGIGTKASTAEADTDQRIVTEDGQEYLVERCVVEEDEVSALYKAFSVENKADDRTRLEIYGEGSNVIN